MGDQPQLTTRRILAGLIGSAFLALGIALARTSPGAVASISILVLVLWAVVLVDPAWFTLRFGKLDTQMGQSAGSAALVLAARSVDEVTAHEVGATQEIKATMTAEATVVHASPDVAAESVAELETERRLAIEALIEAAAVQGWNMARGGAASAPRVTVAWTEEGQPEIVFELLYVGRDGKISEINTYKPQPLVPPGDVTKR